MKLTSPIVIYFLLLQCATTIQAQADTSLPRINTLYMPIGTLYPSDARCHRAYPGWFANDCGRVPLSLI